MAANKQISIQNIQKDSIHSAVDISHPQLNGDLPIAHLVSATASVCLKSLLSADTRVSMINVETSLILQYRRLNVDVSVF